MDEATLNAVHEKVEIIVDSAFDQLTGMPVENAEMVMLNVAEDFLCMAMARLNRKGIDKLLELTCKNIRWRLEEAHKV